MGVGRKGADEVWRTVDHGAIAAHVDLIFNARTIGQR
jgi:hypothetical protein